jgi:hypothetical protein
MIRLKKNNLKTSKTIDPRIVKTKLTLLLKIESISAKQSGEIEVINDLKILLPLFGIKTNNN